MKLSLSILSVILFILLFLPNCFALEEYVAETSDSLVAGIYTSMEQINANEPLHKIEPQLVQYNTADIYFVKKVKLKLLKDVLYRNILNFKIPEIDDASLQFEKNGSKNIFSLKNYTNKQLNNIIAAVNRTELYLVTGSYLNQIAFVKNQTSGRYFYFETPTSTIIEASSNTIFNAGVNNLNATTLLQQPTLKKVGILYDVKTNQLNLLTNNANKNLLIMLPIIKNNPKMLLQFINSARQPEDCKMILQRINAFYKAKTPDF